MSQHQYTYYGLTCQAPEVRRFVEHLIPASGQRATPICIWGRHGIGKTQMVEQIAVERGMQWRAIAPAQFEEMGDLLGMPRVETDANGDTVTRFAAPHWVPTEPGPGILLIDDVNRADERILRGIMQLLQNHELISWALPEGWQIILTANPDGGDYSVTPMDDAMLTRMMHVTMEFDAKAWALWAEQAGVDPRGIDFVLTYPELVDGERTTPRSLVQFFQSIAGIKDLRAELPLVNILARSCLDDTTCAAFVAFVEQNLSQLVAPQAIVEAKDFTKTILPQIERTAGGKMPRIDILATLCTRLYHYLKVNKVKPNAEQMGNLQAFLKMPLLPNDLRLGLMQDMMNGDNPALKGVLADAELAKLFLTNAA
ncbi:AAA family ATPase [Ferrimonas balearica]|uniref:AAA family ATPase n=1 Tax=Ferrimonas balearica TaxID=44012 RepID=UPI001C991BB7|nr:AAA family ATPase [Ferrimonas balearica]MBY5922533.1 AAA family ATPase [Ferrimonas balearica]MBY5995517.1 AAA family ATPase [Ferrimonas balearica]